MTKAKFLAVSSTSLKTCKELFLRLVEDGEPIEPEQQDEVWEAISDIDDALQEIDRQMAEIGLQN